MYYYTGCGVAQDDAEAVGWERRAAEQGNAQAQHNRGVSYRDGLGVVQDYGEAVRWFRRAADQGTLTRSTTSAGCTRTAEGRGVTTKKPRGGIAVWPTRETRYASSSWAAGRRGGSAMPVLGGDPLEPDLGGRTASFSPRHRPLNPNVTPPGLRPGGREGEPQARRCRSRVSVRSSASGPVRRSAGSTRRAQSCASSSCWPKPGGQDRPWSPERSARGGVAAWREACRSPAHAGVSIVHVNVRHGRQWIGCGNSA